MPFVEVDVEHDHRPRGQASHQKPGQQRMSVYKRESKLLLLVVRERQTPDAGVTRGEGVEQREVECPPDLSKDIVRIMQYIVA